MGCRNVPSDGPVTVSWCRSGDNLTLWVRMRRRAPSPMSPFSPPRRALPSRRMARLPASFGGSAGVVAGAPVGVVGGGGHADRDCHRAEGQCDRLGGGGEAKREHDAQAQQRQQGYDEPPLPGAGPPASSCRRNQSGRFMCSPPVSRTNLSVRHAGNGFGCTAPVILLLGHSSLRRQDRCPFVTTIALSPNRPFYVRPKCADAVG